jgi:hypothetical protein
MDIVRELADRLAMLPIDLIPTLKVLWEMFRSDAEDDGEHEAVRQVDDAIAACALVIAEAEALVRVEQ